MNFDITWNKNNYLDFLNYLDSIKDTKYRDFLKKIVACDSVIGIRTNDLKKIAKQIALGDYKSFIENNTSKCHEVIMIEGFIYGFLKISFDELSSYLDKYFKKVNNWSHVDSVVANLKQFKKDEKIGFTYAKSLIHSKKTFMRRAGIIILLEYFLHDSYIDKVLDLVSKIKTDDYYVEMAIAWLLATAYIKYKEKTLVYLVNLENDFIYNKTLSKITDSTKVSKLEKDFIKSLRRNSNKKKVGS